MALFVMACSQAKYTGHLPAAWKYNARQHRALMREFFLNGAYCCHEALILSAQYGFVPLTKWLADYDQLLTESRAAELLADRRQYTVLAKALVGHDEVYLYGGELYRRAVKTVLAAIDFQGAVLEVLGPNRGCCDHFAALQAVFYGMSAEA